MGIRANNIGHLRFYLDGKLIFDNRKPADVLKYKYYLPEIKSNFFKFLPAENFQDLNKKKYHFAIRYSLPFLNNKKWTGYSSKLFFLIRTREEIVSWVSNKQFWKYINLYFLLGVFLTITVLHFLFYLFYPKLKINLYFSLLSLSLTLSILLLYSNSSIDPFIQINRIRLLQLSLFFVTVTSLRFVYSLFLREAPKLFKIILKSSFILCLIGMFYPYLMIKFVGIFTTISIIESFRLAFNKEIDKKGETLEGSWIIGLGAVPLAISGLYNILNSLNLLEFPIIFRTILNPFYTVTFLVLAMSIFLARKFARINWNLELQLNKVKELSEENLKQELKRVELESENKRKKKEFDDARKLQLSMLPTSLPLFSEIDIAAFMETATEVGGDYYDFRVSENGTLTTVIGDATGHGFQAGMMVSAAKSLFNAFEDESDLLVFLKKTSTSIKKMGFKKMFMGFCLTRYINNKMEITSAGMPFPMIFRNETGTVEDIVLKGPPLGSFNKFNYKKVETQLKPGDIILLISDGLTEAFNKKNEMFGTQRVKDLLIKYSGLSSDEIIKSLVNECRNWLGNNPLSDDITIVILKLKPDNL